MRRSLVLTLSTAFVLAKIAQAGTIKIQPTTTLAAETTNNTSTANSFSTQTNGNSGAANVSKINIHGLLYAANSTKVYAHWMGWFGQSNHMNVGYSSTDPAQAHRQVVDMMSRGINGIVVDWYGSGNSIDQATQVMMHEAETHSGFTFAIMVDKGAIKWDSCSGCSPQQALIRHLQYVAQTYFPSPAYMRIGGRPVVTNFDVDQYSIDWNAVKAAVPGNPIYLFQDSGGFTHVISSGSYSWVMPSTTDYGMSYLTNFYTTGKWYPAEQTTGAGYKGFNDTLASWGLNRIMGQQCGKTWINTFGKVNSMYNSSTQLPLLQLVTWNDYEEGTEIESGIDNCLTVGASLSGTATALVSGTTLNFSPQGTGSESATVDHYRVFVSSDGSNLMNLTDLPIGTRSLNLGSYSFGPGTYYFFVKMWGRATVRNKTSGSVKYTVTGVVIKSPVSGSTASNSVHVTATATAVRTPVKVMQIYLDGTKVYEILNTSTLDHYITASSGRWHQIVVQAYDTNYYYFNSSVNVYVP
jgi:hypothetical protein